MMEIIRGEELFLFNLTKRYIENGGEVQLSENDIIHVNFTELFKVAQDHKLLNFVYMHVEKFLNGTFKRLYSKLNTRNKNLCILQEKEIADISGLFKAGGLKHLFVKGVISSYQLYDSIFFRDLGDIDLMVLREDAEKAYSLLVTLGYKQSHSENEDMELPMYGYYHHEILMYKRVTVNQSEVTIWLELKWGSSSFKYNFSDIFEYKQSISINDHSIITLDDDANALHLLVNTYANIESLYVIFTPRIRDLFEAAYFVARNKENIDWNRVLSLSHKMQCQHKVYDVLSAIDRAYGLPDIVAQNWMSQFAIENCKYELAFEDLFVDKEEHTKNDGLNRARHKLHPLYRICHRESAFYYNIIAYKASIYSKINPRYVQREFLHTNQPSKLFFYKKDISPVDFQYFIHIHEREIELNFVIDSAQLIQLKDMQSVMSEKLNIRVLWTDNDIQSSGQNYLVDIPIIKKESPANEMYFPKAYIQYENESIYSEELHRKEMSLSPVRVERSSDENVHTVKLLFSSGNWFTYLDVVDFEVKVIRMEEQYEFSFGANSHMIETIL